jgi:GNAT superfamily N-acetyltransferase
VTLRVATPVGAISVVGEVVEADAEWWSVRRRDGSIALVEVARIEARREIPAGRSVTTSAMELQQIAAFGWRAVETVRLGDWLLRASSGYTQRANSALAIGAPARDVDAALGVVRDWYGERALTPRVLQVDGLGPVELIDRLRAGGWTVGDEVHLMTGEVAHVLRAMPDAVRSAVASGLDLRVEDAPDDAWYACYAAGGPELTEAARQVVAGHPAVLFASLRDGDRAVAVARWSGLFAVRVVPDRRRKGLGAAITLAALKEAARRGGRHVYLQVETSNAGAVELYRRLNLKVHHDYRYWLPK